MYYLCDAFKYLTNLKLLKLDLAINNLEEDTEHIYYLR